MPYMNGKSNGQIALKHPTTELTTPLENEEEDTTEFEEEELRQEEQNNLRHSPTEVKHGQKAKIYWDVSVG